MADLSPRGLPIKQTLPLGRLRKVMAQAMRVSVQTAALSQVTRKMDLTAVQTARQASGLSIDVYILGAVARVLPQHRLLNAELVEDRVLVYEPVNLGMAVAVPDGLVVVVLRDAGWEPEVLVLEPDGTGQVHTDMPRINSVKDRLRSGLAVV
jgi:pyruvate/2-oxoglutarate dehydrogenase complex dihydrolipoamide acyltransferase (E2) component